MNALEIENKASAKFLVGKRIEVSRYGIWDDPNCDFPMSKPVKMKVKEVVTGIKQMFIYGVDSAGQRTKLTMPSLLLSDFVAEGSTDWCDNHTKIVVRMERH